MKKTITAIVAGALFLTLAGCPKKADEAVTTDVATDSDSSVATDLPTDVATDAPSDSSS